MTILSETEIWYTRIPSVPRSRARARLMIDCERTSEIFLIFFPSPFFRPRPHDSRPCFGVPMDERHKKKNNNVINEFFSVCIILSSFTYTSYIVYIRYEIYVYIRSYITYIATGGCRY